MVLQSPLTRKNGLSQIHIPKLRWPTFSLACWWANAILGKIGNCSTTLFFLFFFIIMFTLVQISKGKIKIVWTQRFKHRYICRCPKLSNVCVPHDASFMWEDLSPNIYVRIIAKKKGIILGCWNASIWPIHFLKRIRHSRIHFCHTLIFTAVLYSWSQWIHVHYFC